MPTPELSRQPVIFRFFALSEFATDPDSDTRAPLSATEAQEHMVAAVQKWVYDHCSVYSMLNPDPVFHEGQLVGVACYGNHPTYEAEIRRISAYSYKLREESELRLLTDQQTVQYKAAKKAQREAGVQIATPAGGGVAL